MPHFLSPSTPFLDLTPRAGTASRRDLEEATRAWSGSRLVVARGVLYLWNDHWDAAHEIAQSREGDPDHDFLHGILHRREGDFANAAYWFRSAGDHPCYPYLARRVREMAAEEAGDAEGLPLTATLTKNVIWQPLAFNQAVRTRTRLNEAFLRRIQAAELTAFHEWLKEQ